MTAETSLAWWRAIKSLHTWCLSHEKFSGSPWSCDSEEQALKNKSTAYTNHKFVITATPPASLRQGSETITAPTSGFSDKVPVSSTCTQTCHTADI